METAKKYDLDLSYLQKPDEKQSYNFIFYAGQTVPNQLCQKETNSYNLSIDINKKRINGTV